jgi:arabinan endo-1,5-alpha-L-arabinosidase
MTPTKLLRIAVAALTFAGCGGGGGTDPGPPPTPKCTGACYKNAVLNQDFPDPTVILASDGFYYAFATQTVSGAGQQLNIQGAKSSDLVHWTYLGEVMPTRAAWTGGYWAFWAPHVIYDAASSKYIMYYSAHSQSVNGMCIAIATSTTPNGPYVDVGAPLVCDVGFRDIDPFAFDDPVSGKHYMYWGSDFQPLKVQELDATRMAFAAGSAPASILSPGTEAKYTALIEGPWVIKRGDYYYLFYSGDNCCAGANSSYAVMVARSQSPLGPFQRYGQANGSNVSVILGPGGTWIAPGHNAIITDKAGTDWIVYHAVDVTNPLLPNNAGTRRPMLIDKLQYRADGWPFVTDGVPSSDSLPAPVTGP